MVSFANRLQSWHSHRFEKERKKKRRSISIQRPSVRNLATSEDGHYPKLMLV